MAHNKSENLFSSIFLHNYFFL